MENPAGANSISKNIKFTYLCPVINKLNMDQTLTLLFLLFLCLYALSIHLYRLLRHRHALDKFKRVTHCFITGIHTLIITCIVILKSLWGLEWIHVGKFILLILLANPLLILFYFSDIRPRLHPKASKWISLTALGIYFAFLYIGLWKLDAPAGNWGNSTQIIGAGTILWALSNILLASLMNTAWRFTGILRLMTATSSFITILLTHTTNHHCTETENAYHWLSLFICIYLFYEACLFFFTPTQKS